MPRFLRRALLLVSLASVVGQPVTAGDWPQILGPHRNATAENEPPLGPWPAAELRPKWTTPLGQGYAGPAVAGQRVVVFHRVGDSERVEALDRETGRQLWKADFPANYRGGIDPDHGPRCVPLIHKDAVYVIGAGGDLRCVGLADGKQRWSRSALEEFRGDEGYFGAGSTPLVTGDRLLVNVGGKNKAGIVAFALDTGKTLWQATDEGASYSAPTLATRDGEEIAIFVTRLNCVAISPQDGEVRFRIPFGKRGPTVNAATPLVFNQQLFLSASYGIGAHLYQLDANPPRKIWANDDTLSSQYATSVYHEGHLYGTHGREDAGTPELRCVNVETGKVQWSVPDFRVAHVILSGAQLLIVKVDGQILLARATPDAFQPSGKATVTRDREVTRALPALAGGQLLLRTNDGREGGRLLSIPVGAGR